MSTQGRRSGTRRPRRTSETTIDPAPAFEPAAAPEPAAPAAAAQEHDALLLDDVATPIPGQRGRRLGRSVTGAFFGSLVVVGLTLGAALGPGGALGPRDDASTVTSGDTAALAGDAAGHEGKDGGGEGTGDNDADPKGDDWVDPEATAKPDAGDGGDAEPTRKPEVDPTEKPAKADPTEKPDAPDPTKKPAPEPDRTPKPTEKPAPTKVPTEPIALELGIVEYHPKVAWGSCDGLDFDYYKVVRSKDSTVSWPTGDGDEVIGAVERGGTRKAYDKNAPHGVKVWYRVFCVDKGEDGYKVRNASATKGIEVPEEPAPPPPPDPVALELDFSLTDEGKVVLTWSACEVDGFAFYKVVRSTTGDNPSYLPWTDGTEVIGVVEGKLATEWHDAAPEAGQTAWYRVQCLGYWGDKKVLLGESAVVAVTTP